MFLKSDIQGVKVQSYEIISDLIFLILILKMLHSLMDNGYKYIPDTIGIYYLSVYDTGCDQMAKGINN